MSEIPSKACCARYNIGHKPCQCTALFFVPKVSIQFYVNMKQNYVKCRMNLGTFGPKISHTCSSTLVSDLLVRNYKITTIQGRKLYEEIWQIISPNSHFQLAMLFCPSHSSQIKLYIDFQAKNITCSWSNLQGSPGCGWNCKETRCQKNLSRNRKKEPAKILDRRLNS